MAKSKRAQLMQKQYINNTEEKKDVIIDTFKDEDRRMHQSWCFKNGIFIYIQPTSYYRGSIVIEDNGITTIGQHTYKTDLKKLKTKDDDWSKIIFKLYTQKYLEKNS